MTVVTQRTCFALCDVCTRVKFAPFTFPAFIGSFRLCVLAIWALLTLCPTFALGVLALRACLTLALTSADVLEVTGRTFQALLSARFRLVLTFITLRAFVSPTHR